MPDPIAFESFREALIAATRVHFARYLALHPDEDYYGYALYTDDDVSSIGPAATRASAIRCSPEDLMWICYRFGPHEWNDFDDFELFTHVNQILKVLYASWPFAEYKARALQAAFDALRELEAEGIFGGRDERRFVALWLSDSANPIMERSVLELNAPSVYASFAREYGGTI